MLDADQGFEDDGAGAEGGFEPGAGGCGLVAGVELSAAAAGGAEAAAGEPAAGGGAAGDGEGGVEGGGDVLLEWGAGGQGRVEGGGEVAGVDLGEARGFWRFV